MGNKLKRKAKMAQISPSSRAPIFSANPSVLRDQLAHATADGLLIDVAKLHIPEQLYDADVAWIEKRGPTISLFFAKLNYPETQPQTFSTRLEIRYSVEALRDHLWKNSREFHQTINAGQGGTDLLARGTPVVPPQTLKADKAHSTWANFELMSVTGGEGVIDFYHVDPRSIASFVKSRDASRVTVNAVARVLLPTVELLALLDATAPIASAIPARIE